MGVAVAVAVLVGVGVAVSVGVGVGVIVSVGVGVGVGPPEVDGFDAGPLFEIGGYFFVFGRGDEADIGADEGELGDAVIEEDDAVEDLVVDAGGLTGSVAQKPLRRGWGDVDFDGGGAEFGG